MNPTRAQIIATVGPASHSIEIIRDMAKHQMDVVRINFSWATFDEARERIGTIRTVAQETGRALPIIADMPGPRVQGEAGHGYNAGAASAITDRDREIIMFASQQELEYVAASFVGSVADVEACRAEIAKNGGVSRVIAKIERKAALEHLDEIIAAADAIMIARGDLGHEVPLEDMPYVQADIIKRCNAAGKPVITATQLLSSMIERVEPSRADITDIAQAITLGSDAIMLSDETAAGKYPVQAVAMMEAAAREAEAHMEPRTYNTL